MKKTEGVVSLVVCNPNKAKQEDEKQPTVNATPATTANARSPTPSQVPKEPEKPSQYNFIWSMLEFVQF